MNTNFDVDSFLDQLEIDKKTPATMYSDRISKIRMAANSNQGSIVVAPFLGKTSKNFYVRLAGVKEYYGYTSLLPEDKGGKYLILPIEAYGELSVEQIKLYEEVTALWEQLNSLGGELRVRSYTLLYGILISHKLTSGEFITNNIGHACIFIFPSLVPLNSLSNAIASKTQALKGKKDWVGRVFTPTNSNHSGVLNLSFALEGTKYVSNASFEFNDPMNGIVVVEDSYDEKIVDLFDDQIRDFLGWQCGETSYFNDIAFTELKNNLITDLKGMKPKDTAGEDLDNKNGSLDPMKAEVNIPQTSKKGPF